MNTVGDVCLCRGDVCGRVLWIQWEMCVCVGVMYVGELCGYSGRCVLVWGDVYGKVIWIQWEMCVCVRVMYVG